MSSSSCENKSLSLPDKPGSFENGDPPTTRLESSPIDSPFLIAPISLAHEVCLLTILTSAQALAHAGLAQGIVMADSVGFSFQNETVVSLRWYPAAFSLTSGTFILIAGALGDIFGHKKLLITGFAWYSISSVVTGVSIYSGEVVFFDVCRALQGFGPAILLPAALAILGSIYAPGNRKNIAFAVFGSLSPAGFVIGAAFSALLTESAWWPWAFWILGIACALFMAGAIVMVPSLKPNICSKDEPTSSKPKFDYLGSFLGVAGLVLLNVAWNQAPLDGWSKPSIIVLLILGVLLLIAFGKFESRAGNPILPVAHLNMDCALVLSCVALGWASFGIWMYYLWEFLIRERKLSPLLACAQISPAVLAGFIAAILTGFLLGRIKPTYILVASMVAFCTSDLILATMPVEQSYWKQIFFAVIIAPFGMDMSFPTATVKLSNIVPVEHQGIAASLVATIVNYSISFGLGIGGTVESQMVTNDLLMFRAPWYTAAGLSGCGIMLSLVLVFLDHRS